MNCPICSTPVSFDRPMCGKCGAWVPAGAGVGAPLTEDAFIDMTKVEAQSIERINIGEPWDSVWGGGGIVPSSTTLLAGNPGSGKSTLLLWLSLTLAGLSGKPAYYVASEQAAAELKFTLGRLGMPLKEGQLRVLRSRASGANIDRDVLKKTPPSVLLVDSLTDFCTIRDHAGQVALCKLYRDLGKEFNVPVLLIAQMNKQGDTAGMNRLQHDVDTIVELEPVHEGRTLNRIMREYVTEVEGDLRVIIAWKNRYGPSGVEYPLAMTRSGLVGLAKRAAAKDAGRTGNKVTDLLLERGRLVDELEAAQDTVKEIKGEIDELDVRAERAALKEGQEAAAEAPKKKRRKESNVRLVPP